MITNEFKDLLEGLFEGAYVVDHDRRILFWNSGAEKITGYDRKYVQNSYCFNNLLRHVDENGRELCHDGCPLHKTLESGEILENRVYLHHKKGYRIPVLVRTSPIYDENNNIVAALEVFTDEASNKSLYIENKRLKEATTKDHLTNLYNREFLEYRIEGLMKECELFNQSFGLVFIDIDDFKNINDTYGHLVGDEVLKLIANTMKHNVRDEDVVGRYGGEEFIVLLKVENKNALQKVSEKLRFLVEKSSIVVNNELIRVTISLGASLYTKEDTISSVIERADKAMYQSKKTGKNKVTLA